MLARIEILCFAASYGVALAAELARLVRPAERASWGRRVALAFAAAGLLAQTLFLAQRGQVTATPLSSAFDWYLVAAWALTAIYLYLSLAHPRHPLGVFLLPLVLGLIGAATFFADREPFPTTQAAQVWGAIHGGFLAIGTVAVLVGFMAGSMYLMQAYRLKRKLPPWRRLPLPSLEWLSRLNFRAMIIAVLTLAIGVVSGAILNVVHRGQADELSWTDPVIVSSTITIVWLVTAGLFLALYRPARQGRKVAYLTFVSFAFLLLALGIALFVDTQHGSSPGQRAAVPTAGGAP